MELEQYQLSRSALEKACEIDHYNIIAFERLLDVNLKISDYVGA